MIKSHFALSQANLSVKISYTVHFSVLPIDEIEPDLVERWNALLSGTSDFVSPFFTPGFARSVGMCRNDLFLGVIEQDNSITGLLPFHRRPDGTGVPVGGPVCDYQGVIGSAPLPAMAEQMLQGFGLVSFDFNHALVQQGIFEENNFYRTVSPRADLRQGYETWMTEVSIKTKAFKTIARKERKLEREQGSLRFEIDDDTSDAWDSFLKWKSEALRRHGMAFLQNGWDKDLLNLLRNNREQDFRGRLSTLYAGDRLVAVHFGMATRRCWHWWFPTYDPEMRNVSAGLVLLRRCIEAAANEGIYELDFGRGKERYKKEFSNNARELCEGSIERVCHPMGAARRIRKIAQKHADRWLPGRCSDLIRRSGNRIFRAGQLS